jgi:hypothetical protein
VRFTFLIAVLLELEQGTATILRNVGITLADNTELHSRRYESSAVICFCVEICPVSVENFISNLNSSNK